MLMFGGKGLMQAPIIVFSGPCFSIVIFSCIIFNQNTSNGPMLVCWFQQRWSNVGMLISTTLTRDYGERGGGKRLIFAICKAVKV